jgi:glycosyltransferase involved in cell wall biosynthesis
MKILIIPSWYPWPDSPLRGIFCREQAVYIGQMRPDWAIAIAVWGQRRYTLSLCNPFKTLAVLADFLHSKSKPHKRYLLPNVCEFHRPTLEWTKRWRQGNIEGMVRTCRKILQLVIRDFGSLDLVHAHVTFPGGWIAMKLNLTDSIPYMITEHMGPFPFSEFCNADGTIKEAIREPMRHARAVVAVSSTQAGQIANKGFPHPRVIPNMVDEDFFKLSTREKKIGENFIFFSLTALSTSKGIRDLLQAVAIFLDGLDDSGRNRLEFRIGGGGEEAKSLKALAKGLKIGPWLRWLGPLPRTQTLEMFHSCDCFVLPSHMESFGLALLEALTCGKPVISTRCGGPEFMVTPRNGILVSRQNPTELARAMNEMFLNNKEYKGSLIRQRILEKFSKTVVTDQIETVYREVAGKKPAH